MTTFETKDSGQHEQYSSGMRRDTQQGKPRFALMLTELQPYEEQMLTRYANLLARGAVKYDDRNWEEGDSEEELERAKDSLLRHAMQLIAGETDEDHAAAVWFNTQAVEYFRWRIEQKKLQVAEPAAGLTKRDFQSSGDPKLWAEVGKLEQAPVLPKFPQSGGASHAFDLAKRKFQDQVSAWHNRPITERQVATVGGPWKTADIWAHQKGVMVKDWDGIRPDELVTEADFVTRVTGCTVALKARPDEWLQYYGIELLVGDLGDTYSLLTYEEFEKLLGQPGNTWKMSPTSTLDGSYWDL